MDLFSILYLLTAVLIVLKLVGLVSVSWLLVFAPAATALGLSIGVLLLVFWGFATGKLVEKKKW